MTELTPESMLEAFKQLPPDARQKFRELLERESESQPEQQRGRRVPPLVPYQDRTSEFQWLKEHAREYAGKWVALDGDKLVAVCERGAEVFAAADAAGIDRPFVVQVENPDALPFAGW